jgi:hypothetical protein
LLFLLHATMSNLIKSNRLLVGFCHAPSSRTGIRQTRNKGQDLHETALALLIGPLNSPNDRDDRPTVGVNVVVLYSTTPIGVPVGE